MAFLEINSLVKKFSETTALNDVSLRISDGEIAPSHNGVPAVIKSPS